MTPASAPRLFLDSNVLTSGIVSPWGLDKAVLSLCAARICRMLLAEIVREEVEVNFGTRVQYSVFECVLESKDIDRLQAAIKRIIKPDDRVRYYHLCERCEQHVVTIGGVVTTSPHTLVV